ncbi:MAG TPA: arylsulfatase [Planctomycetota bacterium]|nr:arylsulfatase [Planctomycetota bacterium]HRR81017.1 arylsulfatase [Planctomycetota bacterium]HRT93617.1 arylsulfatase [Planctomycetota bacterium]
MKRRDFLGVAAAAMAAPRVTLGQEKAPVKPNVLLIITDDQGYGDLGCHGNDKIKTPHLDKLAAESVEFTQFYVCPVCAPTRASLMTGRYNYRTGAIDTYLGRAMMHSDEVTIAEFLAAAGYRTGIFGKWHLGDNYPLRPMDQGFQEALTHKGGGLCQPSDFPGNPGYFDPILDHNGKPEKTKGYCTDVYTDAALKFIEASKDRPWFCYHATNAPHIPLQVDDQYAEPYRKMGLGENTAKVYGMVTNIDENVGRLLAKLKELGLEENTIVIFLGDNGPCGSQRDKGQPFRFNAGLRDQKGTVYDGGIRVPFFLRWPARVKGGRKIETIAAHIDVLPTLLAACGLTPPPDLKLDGLSLLPLLTGDKSPWPDRTLYTQWHRGDEPLLYRSCMARTQRWKLVNGKELYDMAADPGEKNDVAAKNPEVVARMRKGYEEWFKDVSATRGFDPPRIVLGAPEENPSLLTRQDWRGPRAGWSPESLGHWEVAVARAGKYRIRLLFAPVAAEASVQCGIGAARVTAIVPKGAREATLDDMALEPGDARLEAWVQTAEATVGVHYVEVKRLD